MSANFTSKNPVDGQTMWNGPASKPEQIIEAMQRARQCLTSWRQTPLTTRMELVRGYAAYLEQHREQITRLISDEVGKLRWDAAGEVNAAIAKAELSIQALQQRRSDQIVNDSAPIQRVVRYTPIGVALVLGPFNFPLHLPGGQIIPALLAGNTVVFKPSDQATAVGQWICDAWESVGLPEDVFQLIVGGVETAVSAIDSPEVNGVFLTGSLQAGRAIHRQLAGRPEVLLALELGGNNPVVVMGDAAEEQVASTLSFSAFISGGQRCTCARRAIFVEGETTTRQIEMLVQSSEQLRVGLPADEPAAHVGPLISGAAADNLQRTYDALLQLGCRPVLPWKRSDRADCLVHPAIVEATNLDETSRRKLGALEWFGPLLVIERVSDFEAALAAAAETPYGLAASLLGGTVELFERFVRDAGAGVVNWNGPTTGAAGALPFGGLGSSGNHRPAGFHAIDFCSDPVASLQRESMADDSPWSVVP